MEYMNDLNVWHITRELLENLCVLCTLITLVFRYYRDKLLELQKTKRRKLFEVILFSLLALITMLFPIHLTKALVFDLRLSVVILATAHLGLKSGLMVALFTIIARSVTGGIGAIWWGSAVLWLVVLTVIIMRFIPNRQWALLTAGIAAGTAHIGVLAIIALFTTKLDLLSPYVSPKNFSQLAVAFIVATAIGVWVLEKIMSDIFIFENQYSELKSKANIDGMTGLINYRYFNELFDKIIQTGNVCPLSLLMIDLDHYKLYNDTYGHTEGDKVLRKTANIIKSCVRGGDDVVARYGGEEFVVILPRTNNNGAGHIAERIRRTIEEAVFPHGKVTVSIGVAVCKDEHCLDKEQLLVDADTFLYAAKQAGRNRVKGYRYE